MSDGNAKKSDDNFSTRLRVLMSTYGYGSIAALARDIGHDRSESLSRINRDPDAKPSVDILVDLSKKFDDLNLDWFLTGVGRPRLSAPRQNQTGKQQGREIPIQKDPQKGSPGGSPDHRIQIVTVAEDGNPNIVMLDAQAAAGLPANLASPEFFANKPAFRLPGYRYNNGTLIAIQVIGDSMHPTVGHEDWLIARHLDDPLMMLREGHVHVLVAQDGVVAKRLYKLPNSSGFLCRSDNELYPPYELPMEEAMAVYRVEGVLSEDLSNNGADIRERIARLEADVMALKRPSKKG